MDGSGDECDPDDDNDGLPDDWEFLYFGDTTIANPGVDSDLDGFTNGEEFIANTNPADINSLFQVDVITLGSSIDFSFQSAVDREYTLEYNEDLVVGVWTNVPGQSDVPGVGGVQVLVDTNDIPIQRHYRITVSKP